MPSFLLVSTIAGLLPAALGFAAGAMLWMLVTELLTEALHQIPPVQVAGVAAAASAAMWGFQSLLTS